MANNYWDNSDADNDANNPNNWSLGNVPTGTDVAYFDNTSDANCTLSANISCAGINVTSVYDGTLDFNNFNFTTTGNMMFAGAGEVKSGTGTLECGGDFHWKNQGIWSQETSKVKLTGTSKLVGSGHAWDDRLYDVEVTGSYTSGGFTISNSLTISGSLVADFFSMKNITNSGTLSGSVNFIVGLIINTGTWSANIGKTDRVTISAGTYGGNWRFGGIWSAGTTTFNAGNFTFTGYIILDDVSSPGGTHIIDWSTNNPNVEFQRDLTLRETNAETLQINKGTGTVTFGGTTEYTDSTVAIQNLGDVDIDGTSLKLLTEMECDDFTLTSGAFDINGQTLDAGGNMDWAVGSTITDPVGGTFEVAGIFTANAQDISGATGEWWLKVDGSAVASGVGDVKYCNAGGFTQIDASAGPWVDSGNNTNWDFGAGESTIQLPTLQIAI